METTTQLYWLTRLDGVLIIFGTLTVIGIIISIFLSLAAVGGDLDLSDKDSLRLFKKFVVIFSISVLGVVFIPSKDEVVFIIAGGKTIDFIKNDTSINKLPSQTTKYISEVLQKEIDKLDKEEK
jgi:hypothetical protein